MSRERTAPFSAVGFTTAIAGARVVQARRDGTITRMDERPPPDPAKLLAYWMEWEKGDTTPGTIMKNLKTGGLRELLEALVAPPAP